MPSSQDHSELRREIVAAAQADPQWFRELVLEILEDEGLARAMQEAEGDETVQLEEVMQALSSEHLTNPAFS